MRRAVLVALILAAFPAVALAQREPGPVDAIGMLNFRHRPTFKPGDWVRYRTRGDSEQGYKTDYSVIALIAGEELWWGEACFWIETTTSFGGGRNATTASLVSYAVFDDSLASKHFLYYMRKYINGFDDSGKPIQELFQRSAAELISRPQEDQVHHKIDTLGVETVEVPKGKFRALRIKDVLREGITRHEGDSTLYYERNEEQNFWYSDSIPITGLVRIDHDNTQRGRSWVAGESKNAELKTLEHAKGSTVVEDYGTGMKSQLPDARFQRPLREQGLTQEKPPAPAKPRRTAARRG